MKSNFLLFPVLQGASLGNYELVCDFGQDCNSLCNSQFCEYRWELNHRHTMSWRTFDAAADSVQDYPIYWDTDTKSLQILGKGWHPSDQPPTDQNGIPKNPIDELENIITADGTAGRRVITINDRFMGPTIKVREGAIVKVIVSNQLPLQDRIYLKTGKNKNIVFFFGYF